MKFQSMYASMSLSIDKLTRPLYYKALKLIQNNEIASMTSCLAQLSPEKKENLMRALQNNAKVLAKEINSRLMLDLLLKHNLDINESVHYKHMPESLFTFALNARIAALNPTLTIPLADMLLNIFQYDIHQLKRFEEQVKSSGLKFYTPLVIDLQTYKEKLLLEENTLKAAENLMSKHGMKKSI